VKTPVWLTAVAVRQIHRHQISQFGGLWGIRDEGMLESALARPFNLWVYERANTFQLAAAYGYGIAMNPPFLDGNKRTAFMVSVLFIELNGCTFFADEVESATTFLSLAAGELDQTELAGWFERWSRRTTDS
jgi:death-on-curing protein